jgi:hypothetical protein
MPSDDSARSSIGHSLKPREQPRGFLCLSVIRGYPLVQDGERARFAVDRHAERLRHAVGADVTVLSARSSEEVGADRWRALSASADPHFLEIWADGILLPIIRSATNEHPAVGMIRVFKAQNFWEFDRSRRATASCVVNFAAY